jgi:mannose/fructose/N-acetylgalactosamine-specific phosphotransferase system component IIC
MKILGFALLLLLWLVLVYAGYVFFGWWMVAFATLGLMWAVFRIRAQRDAAARAAQGPDAGGAKP